MTALVTVLCLLGYVAGYWVYSRYLAERVFSLDAARVTPAHAQRDEVDYVPTGRYILFGHHYASITGLSPMLGPAVAVIWGWAPATLWIVLGALFVGCVHDFGALVVSMRARGMSIGKVTEGIVGRRAKSVFHLVIFFGIALAMGVFVYVIGVLFAISDSWDPQRPMADPASFPTAVLPSAALILIAIVAGHLLYRRKLRVAPVAGVGFILMLLSVGGGIEWPLLWMTPESWPQRSTWILLLLGYAVVASVMPVWSLLQARDFLNSLLLYLGLGLAYAGLFVARPDFVAPAFRPAPEGAPSFLPFVFIIIACGAASGFHSLVASGTTAKQIDREPDARFVGYGGMIGESLLGLLAVLACTAGLVGRDGFTASQVWADTYRGWDSIQGLGNQVGVFITGAAHFIESLGLVDQRTAIAFVAVVVVSFALTTLDSATRLLRFNISEIGETIGLEVLRNRYIASILAVLVIAGFAFYEIDGRPAGLALWQLFGTTNQLLAGLALLVVSLYLYERRRNAWVTAIPMALMLVSTVVAMVTNLRRFWAQWDEGGSILFMVGAALLLLAVWLMVEGVARFVQVRRCPRKENLAIQLDGEKA